MKRLAWFVGAAMVSFWASSAAASTGLCDTNSTTAQACIDAVQASGGAINDIFHDSNGHDAQSLPTYGVLFNQWGPQCDFATFAGCAGYDTAPYDCPGDYGCDGTVPNTFANAAARVAAVDHLWWHPCRTSNHNLDANNCPIIQCVADGDASGFFPWEGLVFDLGGPSNKVAIFATNDHGPQPCESLEYTVYLSDNPVSRSKIDDPSTSGVDPQQWNRAVLKTVYTYGWYNTRAPDPTNHAACGDTADYAVEQDSFVQIFSLPCGITFRYAAVIAGNDGLDFPQCQYASSEAELDAVAGLTEGGAGVCPDADGDHYVDCNCPNAPPVCDCDDSDPKIHPGAPESCDSTIDYNCDGKKGTDCPAGKTCYKGFCDDGCPGENPICPAGSDCEPTNEGKLCVPTDCGGGCPDGTICSQGQCIPDCQHVVCPGDGVCVDGRCVDPCDPNLIKCPPGEMCVAGKCEFPCNCYAGDAGCSDQPGTVCDSGGTNQCVQPNCKGVDCPSGKTCDPTTGNCVDFCNDTVECPVGEKCISPDGCVPLCQGVTCPDGKTCDPKTGKCADKSCANVVCFPPKVCQDGMCVDGSGSGGGSNAGGGNAAGGANVGGGFGSGGNNTDATGGCCGVAGEAPAGRGAAALGLLGLGLLIAARRRRR